MAIGIIGLFGLYLWAWNDAQSAFADVRVVADATPLQCSGIEPGYVEREVDSSSTFSLSRIELRRPMQCSIEFHIQNTGTRDVDVDRVVIPMAAAGAQGARAVAIDWNATAPSDGARPDANFDLGISVRPGEARTFSVSVAFQDGVCLDQGGVMMFDDYVRLELSRWVFDGAPGVQLVPIAFIGTSDTAAGVCGAPVGE